MEKTLIIGSHVSLSAPDYFLGSVKEALSYGSNALMIYTSAPQSSRRSDINLFKVEEAQKLLKCNNIELKNVIVHAPYIVNPASFDIEKHKFAVEFLSEELRRTEKIGAERLVVHPGAHMKMGSEAGVIYAAKTFNEIIENTPNVKAKILIETMSGKGTEVGITFSEVRGMIALIKDKSRIGVCLDTCHINDYGYDISDFDAILEEFDKEIGLQYLECVHVNDSKNERGARKDRHANIGFGYLGFDNLIKIIYHEKLANLPKILETPYVNDKAPYKQEIEMIRNKKFNERLLDEF